ncbi:MAG: hypothetical protein Q4D34_04845 [Eggerthellaceae bacterium]|nr:hypothetical protein [Eggerthellaceae bacterium]
MNSLQDKLYALFDELPIQGEAAQKMRRALIVQGLFRQAIEQVYKDKASYVLSHINAVYIMKNDDTTDKELIIYADDSLIRADLDARQEFIKVALFAQGEEIRTARFIASRGNMKKHHPFVEIEDIEYDNPQYLVYFTQTHHPLDDEQQAAVEAATDLIEDQRVAQSFSKAMRANLETHN